MLISAELSLTTRISGLGPLEYCRTVDEEMDDGGVGGSGWERAVGIGACYVIRIYIYIYIYIVCMSMP